MKTITILMSILAAVGVVASFYNFGHLFFSAIPSAVIAYGSYLDYKEEKKEQDIYYKKA